MKPDPSSGLLAELDLLEVSSEPAPLRTSGAMRKPLHVEYTRDLTEADLKALALPRGTQPKSLVRIHSSHHSLARCLAAGMKPAQAALVTGYNPNRISQLCADSAFQALVEDYSAEARSVFADLAERMSNVSLDAIELLHERLHEKPGEFTIPMLLEVVKSFADRTGHGPGQDVNVKMTHQLIDRPPRESYEEWQERRAGELGKAESPKLISGPAKAVH